ncbi:MAG TPA: chain-length determining protein [Rhodobacteraceae bacterium]|nr:chain-length determining protein [Paracoccaceae bacterium]
MSSNTLGRLGPSGPSGSRARFLPGLAAAPEAEEIDLVALARVLWRGKLWIAAAAVLFATAGWLWATRVAVPYYTAQATVVLEPSQASVVNLDSVVAGLGTDQLSINTEAEVLTSRRLMERLTGRLDLTADPEFNRWLGAEILPPPAVQHDTTLRAVAAAISVANLKASYVFEITAVTTDPAKSAALASALAEVYVADRLQVKFDATEAATGWLTERVAALKRELEASETAVQAFTAGTDLVSPEALAALGRQLKDNRARRADLARTRDAAAAELAALRAALTAGLGTGLGTGDGAALAAAGDATLAQLVADGAGPARIAARAETVAARLEDRRAGAEARITALAAAAEGLAAAYQAQSADLVRLEQMKREAEASRALYEYFLTRLKETAVQQGIQQADARVLSEAAPPLGPSAPRTRRTLVLMMLLGGVAAATLIALREMLNTGVRTAEALEAETGHAVFGQVPKIPARARAEVLAHLVENPTSAAAEAVRNLRTSLMLSNVDRPPQVILSTSAMPGEGKTTLAIALAQNYARLGRKVLLVEGDLRRRVFGEYFALAQNNGLRAVLGAENSFEAVVQPVAALGADVLTGGKSATNAADLFTSDRFATLIKGLRQRYDIIIIDMPPVLLVPDARIVAPRADAVLFAVKWDHTSRAQVAEAIRQFELAGTKITGLVLTQIDPKGMKKYGYAGKYGAYGTYKSDYYDH